MNSSLRDVLQQLVGRKIYDRCSFIWRELKYATRRDANYCPCCNNYIKDWKSFRDYDWSDVYNPDVFNILKDKCLCPICDSAPRHRIETYWLDNSNCIYDRVLLWAPELCITTYFKNKKASIVTADMNRERAMYQEDIECSSFNSKEFDLIICNHVLEHVLDVERALKDSARILKDSGTLLITVPIDFSHIKTIDSINSHSSDNGLPKFGNVDSDVTNIVDISRNQEDFRKMMFGQNDHLRLFGKDFENLLTANGFDVDRYAGDEISDSRILPIVGPSDYDSNVVFVCHKKQAIST